MMHIHCTVEITPVYLYIFDIRSTLKRNASNTILVHSGPAATDASSIRPMCFGSPDEANTMLIQSFILCNDDCAVPNSPIMYSIVCSRLSTFIERRSNDGQNQQSLPALRRTGNREHRTRLPACARRTGGLHRPARWPMYSPTVSRLKVLVGE